ncbi:protein FAM204A-like [Sinocyclocheilus grahami]|uniref:protein FAM204A-like n=1 Tax=Sinocyclocheilus grahami TaxID=75366 RepID=UPI0007AD6582|nr:PREDICTED: protein FAM204A-like [Sinocyclocheilus grahami]
MYSGLLPPGLTESDLSSDDADEGEAAENRQDEQLSRQSDTETHSACAQVECNNTKTGLHNDAFGDECLPGVSLDKWQKFKELQKAKDDQRMKEPQTKRKRRHKKGHYNKFSSHYLPMLFYFQSGLEKSIESAIAEGDCGKAEELSDRLATRELAVKIAQAADCRDFTRTKQEAEASRAARKRRKQIAWGFEAKKRWETKSNMGFM